MIFSIPDDFPFDKDELLKSGIDADIVELEPEDKGGRVGYDDVNENLVTRRQMIRAQTVRIKTAKKEAYEIAEEKRRTDEASNSARGHLGDLVKQPTRRVVPVFGSSRWQLGKLEEEEEDKEEEEAGEQGEGEEPIDNKEEKVGAEDNGGEDEFVDNDNAVEGHIESA